MNNHVKYQASRHGVARLGEAGQGMPRLGSVCQRRVGQGRDKMRQIDLNLSQEAFEQLHDLNNSKKSTIRIQKVVLTQILLDYSLMLASLRSSTSFKVNEPVARRARPRLKAV
jgi:hypothetical protein